MANEAWKIGVAIALEGGITGQLAEVISEFERMETIIDKIASALGKLGGRFESASTGAKGLETAGTDIAEVWGKASRSIESAAKFAREAGNVKIPSFTPPRVPNAPGNGGAHGSGYGAAAAHFGMAGVEGSMALQGPSEFLQHVGSEAYAAGKEYETPHELFVGRKDYDPKMETEFNEKTAALAKEHTRVPLNVIREIVLTAIRNTGSPEHAYEGAEDVITYQDYAQTIGMQHGLSAKDAVAAAIEKSEASFKAAELDGAVAKNIIDPKTGKPKLNAAGEIQTEFNGEKFHAIFDMLERVLKGSGGTVDGGKLKDMIVQGSISIIGDSILGLQNKLTEAQTQNSHKIGTASRALFQQFTTGISKQKNFDEMKDQLHLYDNAVGWVKGKGVTLVHPRDKADTIEKHMAGYGTDHAANADFTGFVQKEIIPRLEKLGMNDPMDQAKYIAQFMQTATAGREMVENILMGGLINKDRQFNFDPQITGREGADKLASGAKGTELEMNAAWENSLTVIGTQIIPALTPLMKDLTTELLRFSEWAKDNPTTVKQLGELGLAIIALDKACGALVAGGMVIGGLKNLGLAIRGFGTAMEVFEVGSAAAGAIALLASPVGGVLAISAGIIAFSAAIVELGTHLDAVKDALKGVFTTVKDGIVNAITGPAPKPAILPPSAQQLPSALGQKPFMLAPGGLMNMGPIGAGNFKKSAYEMPLPNSGGAMTRQAAYISPPPANVTVNPIVQIAHNPDADRPQIVHVYLDGKDITNNVTMRMAKDLNGPRRGPTTYDSRMSASYPGTTSA